MSLSFVQENFVIGQKSPDISPQFVFYKRGFNLGGSSVPGWREVTLSGIGSLSLVNAIKDGLVSLRLFGGTELAPETYIDSVTLEGKCVQRNLPEGYTEYDGLIGDGDAYIDLDCSLDQDDEIEIELSISSATTSRNLFGYRSSASSNNISALFGSTGTLVADFNNSDYATYRLNETVNTDTRYKLVINKTGRYLYQVDDGSLVGSNTNACADTISCLSTYLFNTAGLPGATAKFNGTIHRCLIKGKRDVVPCGNGTAYGMYDKLNGVFYPNANTEGSFTVGNAVIPTPDYPIDIVCNNGTLKLSPNLVEFNETRINSSTWDNADKTKGFEVYADVYTKSIGDNMLTNVNAFGAFVPCKQGESVSLDFFDYAPFYTRCFYCEITADRKCNTTPQEYANSTTSTITQKTFTLTQSDSIGFVFEWYINSQQTRNYTASNYMVVRGSTPPTKYIPYGKIYYDGTVETVTDSNGLTATAQPLLSVGNYKDTQEVISGAVARNVGIKILDGTEDWTASSSYAGSCYWTPQGATNIAISYVGLCTHFASASALSQYARGKYLQELNAINLWYSDNATTAVANLKQFLAEQYANGTPVIVVYALYTPTTETVSGQVLNKTPITYAGSLTGLTGTVVESSHTVPKPTQPLDIVANNGVITLSPNLIDESTLYIVSNTMWRYYSTPSQGGFDLKANTTYTLSTDNSDVYVYFYDYNTKTSLASGKNHRTYTPTADVKVYFTLYLSSGIPEGTHIQLEIGSTATTYRPYGSVYYDGDIETVEVIGKNLFDGEIEIGSINPADGSLVVNSSRTRSKNFIRVKPNTTYTFTREDTNGIRWIVGYNENKVGITDGNFSSQASAITNLQASSTVTKTFTTTATTYYIKWYNTSNAGLNEKIQVELGDTATTYEPYFNGGTATAQPLLSVGTTKDVQNITTGEVTRNLGIYVVTGAEDWSYNDRYGRYNATINSIERSAQLYEFLCTHGVSSTGAQGTWSIRNNKVLSFYDNQSEFASLDIFKKFFADEYAAGHPAIIVYEKETPTTESVTPQPLTIQAGTNVVEITQASIDNLELEVSYKAGVEVTVEEIEAVNNDESVEVTING